MFAYQRKKVGLALALTDLALVSIAFFLAYATRFNLTLEREFFLPIGRQLTLLAITILSWLAIAVSSRIYEHLDSAQWTRIIRATVRQCLLGTACVVLFEYFARWDLSRSFLFFLFLYALTLLGLFRINSKRIVRLFLREFGRPYHVIVVGSAPSAAQLGAQLVEGSPFRIQLAGIFTAEECGSRLPVLVQQQIIDEVIFRVNSESLPSLEDTFLLCDEEGIRTRVAADFFPHVNSRMTLDRFGTAPLLTFSAAPDDDLRLVVKRAFDIAISLAVLIVSSPFMALVAVLIRLTSPGPVIFKQLRCGLNGRHFQFYKFRSMVRNAEQLKAEIAHLNEKTTAFKISHDPRFTPIGKWLRKFSIDELPQFFNVFRGDMSIVGPRPAVPSEVDHYERWQRRRLRMRPGLTCLWAVRGRDKLDFETWMKMDMEYIDNWSLLLDLKIILKSIPYVLTGRGAY
ncbi:MAG: exopolysaccharide biosynthesis polyprenyl glycosylphosphotransferase [Bryobacteraceae bacterium]